MNSSNQKIVWVVETLNEFVRKKLYILGGEKKTQH